MESHLKNRRNKSFGVHRPLHFSSLHRAKGSYLRSRTRHRYLPQTRQRTRASSELSSHDLCGFVPWSPGDDYLLITAVSRTWNLNEVFHTVRFAHFYTEEEIEDRWRSLLFDPVVSSTALNAISRLPQFIKSQLDRQIPFSQAEEDCLVQVSQSDVFPDGIFKSLTLRDLEDSVFTKLLHENPTVFYTGRDELDLFRHWSRLQSCLAMTQSSVHPAADPRAQTNTDTPPVPTTKSFNLREHQIGGDPESFSDTELLLEETVRSALAAGVEKLTEPSSVARRQHMLTQPSYHGFQALVTECVLNGLTEVQNDTGIAGRNAMMMMMRSPPVDQQQTQSAVSKNSALTSTTPPATASAASGMHFRRERLNAMGSEMSASDLHLRKLLEFQRRRRRTWARLRSTGEQAKRWTGLVEIWAAKGLELTDRQPIQPTLAALTGSRTRYLINEREVIFGRSSFAYKPHIDLSLEGHAVRISRCHGRIRLDSDGYFWLSNFSTHPVFVDGHPVLKDEEVELRDMATVLVGRLALRFDINRLYLRAVTENGPTEDIVNGPTTTENLKSEPDSPVQTSEEARPN